MNDSKIDVHVHYLPPAFRAAAEAAGISQPDGIPGFPDWDVASALATMEAVNIETAMLSLSSPGVHFGNAAAAAELARTVNEAGAQVVRDHPGQFGLFAVLPVPEVDRALAEITYAFDELRADGVVLLTNTQGVYLGDVRLDPVFAELNRREAVVFIHPTSPYCPQCHGTGLDFPRPMMEFLFETTRAVTNLIFSGTLARFPKLKIIVPHAGATLPVMADRLAGTAPMLGMENPVSAAEFFAHLNRLHYDLAGFPVPRLLKALLEVADPTRILYGSDYPFTPLPVVTDLAEKLTTTDVIDARLKQQFFRDNGLALFPRLSGA